jgi:CHASE2 domain-containing sensor protein
MFFSWNRTLLKVALGTLVVLSITFYGYPAFRNMKSIKLLVEYYDPAYQKDYDFTDVSFSRRTQYTTSTDRTRLITIVDVSCLPLDSITLVYNAVLKANPKAIGLDLVNGWECSSPSQNAELVIDSDNDFHKTVIAVREPSEVCHQVSESKSYGFTTFSSQCSDSVKYKRLRRFTPVVDCQGGLAKSFAVMISYLADSAATTKFMKSLTDNSQLPIINYVNSVSPNYFQTVNGKSLLHQNDFVDHINNRIVLISRNTSRQIWTPKNPVTLGNSPPDSSPIEVHANIVESIVEQQFITEVSTLNIFLLTAILTIIHVFLLELINQRLPVYYDSLTFLIGALLWVSLIAIQEYLLVTNNIKADLTVSILSLILVSFYNILYEARSLIRFKRNNSV